MMRAPPLLVYVASAAALFCPAGGWWVFLGGVAGFGAASALAARDRPTNGS